MLGATPRKHAARTMAFVSDVHGNLDALKAVLGELEHRGARELFVAGDLVYGGDQPLEVWQLLQQLNARCTRGISDTALSAVNPSALRPENEQQRLLAERFRDTRKRLGDLVLERIRRLPEKLRVPLVDGSEIVMVHGAPVDPSQEMSHDMDDDELLALVADDPADIVVCGASHVPFQRQLDGLRIINVGSVGAAPEGRVAHFSVLTSEMDGTRIEQGWAEY